MSNRVCQSRRRYAGFFALAIITVRNVYRCSIPVAYRTRPSAYKPGKTRPKLTLDLDIHRRLDEMRRVDRSVGNETSFIPRLKTKSRHYRLDVSDKRVRSGLGRAEKAKVVDAVQSQKSRIARLIDNAADFGKGGSIRVGGTVGERGDDTDLALSESGGDKGGKEGGGEQTGRHVGRSGVSALSNGELRGGKWRMRRSVQGDIDDCPTGSLKEAVAVREHAIRYDYNLSSKRTAREANYTNKVARSPRATSHQTAGTKGGKLLIRLMRVCAKAAGQRKTNAWHCSLNPDRV